jgi:hypothetical protein
VRNNVRRQTRADGRTESLRYFGNRLYTIRAITTMIHRSNPVYKELRYIDWVATTLTVITGGSRKRDGWDRAFYPLAASVGDDDHHGLYSRWRVTSMCSQASMLPYVFILYEDPWDAKSVRIKGNKNASRLGHFSQLGGVSIAFTCRRTEVHPVFCCCFYQQSCVLGDFTIDSIAH